MLAFYLLVPSDLLMKRNHIFCEVQWGWMKSLLVLDQDTAKVLAHEMQEPGLDDVHPCLKELDAKTKSSETSNKNTLKERLFYLNGKLVSFQDLATFKPPKQYWYMVGD